MNENEKNYKYFQDNISGFLANPLYKDKFLVISKQKVQNSFDTFSTALQYATATFAEGEFIIQEVVDESKIVNFIKSAS